MLAKYTQESKESLFFNYKEADYDVTRNENGAP
jgi:hypothetical protein